MTSIAKSHKGQFIVVAAMFIVLIILSMSLMIYSAGSRYQILKKEPVREIVQTITDDFKRMLTLALADYSEDKNEDAFRKTVFSWASKTLYCYSGMGLQLNVTITDDSPYINTPGEDSFEGSFEIGANVTLNFNITSIGFYGYEYPAQLKLNVTMNELLWGLNPEGTAIAFLNMTVQALREGSLPVSDLEITRLNITVYNDTEPHNISIGDIDIAYVSGSGTYIVTLKQKSLIPTGLNNIKSLEAHLEFMDGRGIQGYVWKEGIPVNLIYVRDIIMEPVKKGEKYWIYTYVIILDRFDKPVSGATVSLIMTLPDNTDIPLSANTDKDGAALFKYRLNSAPKGTYKAKVINVVKEGYFYNPKFNHETEDSLTI
ncbi:carboxypeptidase regulatory-like domain-containing protein [Candidatus Bathyarchaeota archaeon]|nr:carboxypeptidase regulatory-like domain-containing protein [Candidatus Bathyarchaeota archaeon]MBS7613689.1 carboxypeptidase regulatory-like domain-containing protein [Candidatus Bathyarchaeota archaeon]MBS7618337.1 carboxypeptidase regulatory-like domain-containing protein [Candidatus Bathyarchaeota archaeon]